jgi:hypothetical protein
MTQITHEEARRLIQFNLDYALDNIKLSSLDAHLEECKECSTYAAELKELENNLRRAMQRRWNLSPAPLPIYAITSRVQSKAIGFTNNVVVTRMAVITLAILVIMFGTWQFSRTNNAISSQMLTFAIPIPTPSTHLTSTSDKLQSCDYILYQVQNNDTLESVALQYAASKVDIMQLNNMKTETLDPSMQIRIPLCHSTPTGTINAPTTTITITPQFELHTSTPG